MTPDHLDGGKSGFSGARAMRQAISRKDVDDVRRLIDEGVDVNVLTMPFVMRTALMDAAEDGCQDLVELLITSGANLEMRDDEGMSALDILEFYGDEYGVKDLLLSYGAIRNPNLKTRQDELNEYYEACEQLQSHYFDDRVYLYDVSCQLSDILLQVEGSKPWSVTSRRNVHGYPPVGIIWFQTHAEAMEFVRKVAPATPRVSLGNRPPDPVPSWDDHQLWVDEIEATDRKRNEVKRLLRWPKPRSYNKHGKRGRYANSSPPCLQERALRSAIRRRLSKPHRGHRRLLLQPVHSMVCLVASQPSLAYAASARARPANLKPSNFRYTRIRPLRLDLYLENPRRTLPEGRLDAILRLEADNSATLIQICKKIHGSKEG